MTTIAYDGRMLAADSLATCAGLRHTRVKKIHRGLLSSGERFQIGIAGDQAQGIRLAKIVERFTLDEIRQGKWIDEFDSDRFNPGAILVIKATTRRRAAFAHIGGCFIPLSRPYHAIGSGRDYALAAMALGRSAHTAVGIAAQFDVDTGGRIFAYEV